MFGNLFEEMETGVEAGSIWAKGDMVVSECEGVEHEDDVDTMICKERKMYPPPPPLPRPQTKLCGIENQGGTCYLNSLLQTLLFTPEFRESLFQLSVEELGRLEEKDVPGSCVRVIPIQLQRLFARLLLLDQNSLSTVELTDSFGWTSSEEMQQHDVQELNRILFAALESSLIGTSGSDLISKYFCGSVVNKVSCKSCGHVSEREESFLDLNVAVGSHLKLEESLYSYFVEEEVMNGSNQYKCSSCGHLVDAVKGVKIQHLPPVLTLSLLRFSYNFVTLERYKETGRFSFPIELDMGAFCEKGQGSDETLYDLYSVVIHRGGTHGGHYHAHIKDVDKLGTWLPPERQSISVAVNSCGQVNYHHCDTPVKLLEALLLQQPHCTIKLDKLCVELQQETGISWNECFRQQWGPITKFLRNHSECFYFSSLTKTVSLKHFPSTLLSDLADDSFSDNLEVFSICEPELNSGDSKHEDVNCDTTLNSSSSEDVWFDFNDSCVRPIHAKDIEQQFSGKESAYMLFYRQKCLQRPKSAQGNQTHAMPAYLVEMVKKENEKLKEERNEYDLAVNKMMVEVLPAANYRVCQSALQAVPGSVTTSLELLVSKKSTLTEVQKDIQEHYSDICLTGMHLHIARETVCGLHLYQELQNGSTCLREQGVTNTTKIFIWDGREVGGQLYQAGPEHEPVLLHIMVTYKDKPAVETFEGFPRSISLGKLRKWLSDFSSIPPCQINLTYMENKNSMSRTFISNVNDDNTLQDLKIEDHGKMFVEENMKGEDVVLAQDASKDMKLTLTVENRTSMGHLTPEEGESRAVVVLLISDTVLQLKQSVMKQLKLTSAEYRLCLEHEDLGLFLPLHDHLCLQEAMIGPDSHLIIEEGKSPEYNKVCVYYSLFHGSADTNRWHELFLTRWTTVEECFRLILQSENLDGDEWHLRKLNWNGEAGDVLDEPSATLEQENVTHGEHVILCKGGLPPRGYLQISLLLYPTLDQGCDHVTSDWVIGPLQALWTSAQGHKMTSEEAKPIPVGNIEISKQSTLENLKQLVITQPPITYLNLPAVGFIRLRVVEKGGWLGHILKDHSQMMKSLKISTGRLAVQVLPQEENLGPKHVVLKIVQHLPDTNLYTEPCELVWNAVHPTPDSLQQAIANHLLIPAETILMAKHFREKYEWHVIKNIGQDDWKGNGKRKTNIGKTDLQKAPYYLKDGDTVGIKDLTFPWEDTEDFSTEKDIVGQNQLKEQEMQKRAWRRKKSDSNSDIEAKGPSKNTRQERELKIKVADFTK